MAKKPKKIPLTAKREKWVQNRDARLVGEPLRVSPFFAQKQARIAMSEVRKMHLDVSKQVEELFRSELAKETYHDVAMDASLPAQSRMLINMLRRTWDKRFNLFAKEFSTNLFANIEQQTAKDLRKSMEKLTGGLTIDTSRMTQGTRDVIQAGTQQAASLIKTISGEYLSEVSEAMMRSIASPKATFTDTVAAIHEMLQGRYKVYKNKAKNIALDQTRKAYSTVTEQRMKSVGITKYRWRHAGGSQEPRKLHRDVLNGKVFSLDDPPIIDERTGERGRPGDAINCFPGNSVVSYGFGVRRAYRHFYTGESTELVTSSGRVLKSTPNHPILTQRGWVAAHAVDCGDYVIDIEHDGINAFKGYGQNIKTSISDMFYALSLLGLVESSAATGGELHGDVTDSKIDIVSANWQLMLNGKSERYERLHELALPATDATLNSSSGYGALFKFVKAATLAPDSFVSGCCNLLSVGFCRLGHPDFSGFTSTSYAEAFLYYALSDVATRNPEMFSDSEDGKLLGMKVLKLLAWDIISWLRGRVASGDFDPSLPELNAEIVGMAAKLGTYLLDGQAAGKKFSRIVEKRVGEFSGHVYNLEMDDGLYCVESIAVSNCKCYMEPVVEFNNAEADNG